MSPLVTIWLRALAIGVALILGVSAGHAYHYPWDQGHDIFNWNDPTDPGPCQQSTCDPCNSTGSPVYIPTGHFIWSDTDIVLKGRPRIALVRTYNSHDSRDGLFGNGWTVGCDVGLYRVIDSGVTKYVLRSADGKRYEYTQQADGSVTSPAGRFERVVPQVDGSVHLVYLDGTRKVFRADGKLAADVDANGNEVRYSYDADGRLARIADTHGRYLDLAYNSRGRVSTVTDHTARRWQYAYDLNGNLTSRTDPLNGVRQYQYAAYTPTGDAFTYQHLTRITDESGVVLTQVTYSGERVLTYTEGANRYTFAYNTTTKTVTKTDILGSRWTFVYNDQGLITQETDPLGYRVTHVYDANGLETQTTDELGKIWKATYDGLGRLTSRTNPLNETTTLAYEGDNPNPITITSPSGRVTRIAYDANLDPVAVTDPSGAVSRMEWSASGDLVATVDALLNRTELAHSAIGQPLAVTDPLGRMTQYGYDAAGNQNLVENAAGEATQIEHDALDRPLAVTDSLGGITSFTYDAAGRLESMTDPAGGVTSYAYDQYGRRVQETVPDGRTTTFAYRTDNLLSSIRQPNNSLISYGYDAAKRLTQENAAGLVASYSYDARGDLIGASNPAGSISRLIDAAGRLLQETNNGRPVQIAWNADGERIRLTALGSTTEYTLDPRGLIDGITDLSGTYDFTYDAAGRRRQLLLPNGAAIDYGYDAASQLTSIGHSGPFSTTFGYVFDAAARITQMSGDGADWDYYYDALGRLTRADHGADSFAYAYDSVGNILNDGRVHDAANRLVEDDTHTYTYDLNGNLIRKQDKTTGARTVYVWNAKNQLVSYQRFADGVATLPDKTIAFGYDALGRRASKTEDGVVERYVYDGNDLIGVLDGLGNLTASFVFGPGIDEPLRMTAVAGSRYFHANHLGSVVALTGQGATHSQYQYEPFGATTVHGESANPFRFTAREQDSDDLYYYRARYYDPLLQRFLSEDPVRLAGGINLYAYVGNSPANFVDPYGEFAWIAAGAAIGAVINVGVTYIANGGNVTGQQLAAAAVSGAISGALGAVAGPLGGTIAGGLGAASNGLLAAIASGVLSGAGAGLGQAAANAIDPCHATNPLNAALWGGIGGGAAKGLFPTRNLNSWAQAQYFGPKTIGGLFGSSNAWLNLGAFGTSSGVGTAANFPAINPF